MAIVWAAFHVHYYNQLVALRTDAEKAWAQVEVQEQRRFHIQKNLVRIVMDYAKHEQQMHKQLTQMRVGQTASQPAHPDQPAAQSAETNSNPVLGGTAVDQLTPSQLKRLLPKLQIVAEQYANLRLSENFQQLSAALIDTETKIAETIMEYNTRVNVYTTKLKQFPSNLFASLGGFELMEFYQPARDKLGFSPIEY